MEELKRFYDAVAAAHGRFMEHSRQFRENRNMTPEGKEEFIAPLRAEYRRTVKIQEDAARAHIETERRKAHKLIAQQRADAVAAVRGALGDTLYADLVRRQVETMEAGAIVDAFQVAGGDFERELIRGYGTLELRRREAETAKTGAPVQEREALAALAPVDDLTPKLRERLTDLEIAERDLVRIDPDVAARERTEFAEMVRAM